MSKTRFTPNNQHKDFFLEIAAGRVPTYSYINAFGRNADVDTNSDPEDIWDAGGLWVPPTAARTHNIASSSANDNGTTLSSGTIDTGSTTTLVDNDATFSSDGVSSGDTVISDENFAHATVTGVAETTLTLQTARHNRAFVAGNTYKVVTPASTGASVIHIYGLDSNMLSQEEFVVMNGTSNVATASTYYRIDRMHVDASNNRTANIGDITATAQTDGTVTAQISADRGRSLMSIFTVPNNKRAYITDFYAHMNRGGSPSGAMADISLLSVPFANVGGAGIRVEHWSGISIEGGVDVQHFTVPHVIDPNTDLILRVESVTDNNSDISGGFKLILQDLAGDTGW